MILSSCKQKDEQQGPSQHTVEFAQDRHLHHGVKWAQFHNLALLGGQLAVQSAFREQVQAEDHGRQQRSVEAVVGVDVAGEGCSDGGEPVTSCDIGWVGIPAGDGETSVFEPTRFSIVLGHGSDLRAEVVPRLAVNGAVYVEVLATRVRSSAEFYGECRLLSVGEEGDVVVEV